MGRKSRIKRRSRRESKRQVEARRPRWLRHHFDVPSVPAPWTGIALSSTILTIAVVKLIFAQLKIKEIKEKRGIKKKNREGRGRKAARAGYLSFGTPSNQLTTIRKNSKRGYLKKKNK